MELDIITDHKALVSVLHCQDTAGKLARWNVDLYPYDFKVHYRPRAQLGNADGLSRLLTDKELRSGAPTPNQIRSVAAMVRSVWPVPPSRMGPCDVLREITSGIG